MNIRLHGPSKPEPQTGAGITTEDTKDTKGTEDTEEERTVPFSVSFCVLCALCEVLENPVPLVVVPLPLRSASEKICAPCGRNRVLLQKISLAHSGFTESLVDSGRVIDTPSGMSSRPILTVASLCVLAGLGACQSRYADTYSFKKNNFQPPVVVHKDLTPPPVIDPLQGGAAPPTTPPPGGDPSALPAVPGVPGTPPPTNAAPSAVTPPPTNIPGLDAAPPPK